MGKIPLLNFLDILYIIPNFCSICQVSLKVLIEKVVKAEEVDGVDRGY